MIETAITKVYAKALLELAEERKEIDTIEEELLSIKEIFSKDPEIQEFVSSPVVRLEDKSSVMEKVFSGKISETTQSFLGVLVQKNRLEDLEGIIEAFSLQLNKLKNRKNVTVFSAESLSKEVMDKIQSSIAKKFNTTCIMQNIVDPSRIGGFAIQVEDTWIDATIQHKLDDLKSLLLNSNIPLGDYYEN
jgi:F-type H+-transporting ATPase subunit delta